MDLSIVIPAYNEETRINKTLDAYLSVDVPQDLEVIVVVNGSNDRTAELVRARSEINTERLRVIEIPEAVGKGGAVLRGFKESQGNRIAYTDADGSTPPEALLDLYGKLSGSGVIIGSRWLRDSKVGTPQPLSRRLASRSFNPLVRLFFGIHVTDTQCGAKILSRDVVEAVLPVVGCTQWAFDVDLLFQTQRAGFSIQEEPIVWNDIKGSKVHLLRASLQMTLALTRLRLIYSPFKPVVDLWDSTLGRKLFDRRMQHLNTIHRTGQDEG